MGKLRQAVLKKLGPMRKGKVTQATNLICSIQEDPITKAHAAKIERLETLIIFLFHEPADSVLRY